MDNWRASIALEGNDILHDGSIYAHWKRVIQRCSIDRDMGHEQPNFCNCYCCNTEMKGMRERRNVGQREWKGGYACMDARLGDQSGLGIARASGRSLAVHVKGNLWWAP